MDRREERARASVIRAIFLVVATALVATFGIALAHATSARQSDASPPASATTGSTVEVPASTAAEAGDEQVDSAGANPTPVAEPNAAPPLVALVPAVEPAGVTSGAPSPAPTTTRGRAPPAE